MSEERGVGESVTSETLSLMSHTLRYVRLEDLVRHGEGADSEVLSLLSYTLRYVRLEDLTDTDEVRTQNRYLGCHTHLHTSVSRT